MQFGSVCALLATGVAVLTVPAQPEDRKPLAFEVISVKPAKPGARGGGIRPLPGGQTYRAENATLRLMIKLMYKITDAQIAGGPGWMDTDLWDVEAKAEKPSTVDELHEMFQTLLADRFQLKFHKEKRQMAALVMVVDKGGPKMKANESPEAFDFPIKPAGPGKIIGTRVPMPYLCWFFAQQFNTPVVDQTGLTGNYDFTFEIPLPPPPAPGTPEANARLSPADLLPEAMAAMREQLGLKLESRKAPVEVFVIDRAEKPEGN